MMERLRPPEQVQFWRTVQDMFHAGTFTDTVIVCDSNHQTRCHGLVLAAMSPMLRAAIGEGTADTLGQEQATVVLQGIPGEAVKAAIDAIYR